MDSTWARSEDGLSRLPVTEEIAGSNPVGPASKKASAVGRCFFTAQTCLRCEPCRRQWFGKARTRTGTCSEHVGAAKRGVRYPVRLAK